MKYIQYGNQENNFQEGFYLMAGISNTSRTLEYIRSQGWEAEKVEYFNPYARKRKDLFGIIDIVALGDKGIIGVQSCGNNFSQHNEKILSEPMAFKWLQKGGTLMLIGWRKVKLHRGAKAMRWSPRIAYYHLKNEQICCVESQK